MRLGVIRAAVLVASSDLDLVLAPLGEAGDRVLPVRPPHQPKHPLREPAMATATVRSFLCTPVWLVDAKSL